MEQPNTEYSTPLEIMTVVAAATAEIDSQLFSTLCEIDKYNYLYLFERCRLCNVNARQLRYFEKEHIRELIPKTHLGILAEFEYLLNEWKIRQGFIKDPSSIPATTQIRAQPQSINKPYMMGKRTQTNVKVTPAIGVNTLPLELQEHSISSMVFNEDTELLTVLSYADNSMNHSMNTSMIKNPISLSTRRQSYDFDPFGDRFDLEKIIPLVLKKCKQNYKIKNLLTEGDRRLLASSIVEYFEMRRCRLRPDIMENLADQISKHFPTEAERDWYHCENSRGRGLLCNAHRSRPLRHYNQKRKKNTETAIKTKTTEGPLLKDIEAMDNDKNGKRIQNSLKTNINIWEDFSEIVDMWKESLKYRHLQIKYLNDIESFREFLENWPSYKWERGYELLSMDFQNFHPNAMSIFRSRWLVYKQNIVDLLEAKLKDNNCLEILTQYQTKKDYLNEDSSSCALIYMIHGITKPNRTHKFATGSVRYRIKDSQYSMTRLIHNLDDMDEYREAYPCIFVLGETLFDIQECYVVFMNIKYRLSYADCLIVCMQLYSLFKLEDPLPSLHFWQFVRAYFFNIPKANERSLAVVDKLVSNLESKAHI